MCWKVPSISNASTIWSEGNQPLQEPPEVRSVPFVKAELVNATPDRVFGLGLEEPVECTVGRHDVQVFSEDKQGAADGLDDVVGVNVTNGAQHPRI